MQFSLGALEALRNRRNDKAAKHKSIIEEKGSINLTARRSGVELQCVVRLSVWTLREERGTRLHAELGFECHGLPSLK